MAKYIWDLKQFDPLWQQDLYATHQKFLDTSPTDDQCKEKIQEFLDMQMDVRASIRELL